MTDTTPITPTDRRMIVIAAAIDLVSVVAFVIIGRKNHHEDGSFLSGTARVVAPFLIALVVGWIVAKAWRSPAAIGTGVIVWLCTVVLGLALRRFAWDDGAAAPFVMVTTGFTGACLLGWRFIADWRNSRGVTAA